MFDLSRIEVIQGDITQLDVDVIVNAANSSLRAGAGVCGAIHDAAGPELEKECLAIGGCQTGEARITKGYHLPAKWVIHTVGPVWQGGSRGEEQLLAKCYRNSLLLAEQHYLHSIAFPSISTGIFGYPIEQAAQVAIDEVIQFIAKSATPGRIIFVCFTAKDFDIYKRLLSSIQVA